MSFYDAQIFRLRALVPGLNAATHRLSTALLRALGKCSRLCELVLRHQPLLWVCLSLRIAVQS